MSYFPAYYLSWGRYTHLAGILLLPLWQVARKPDWRSTTLTVLLACGLALIHIRIAFFAAVFAIELALILLWRRQWKALAAWGLAAALSFAIVSPWLLRVARSRGGADADYLRNLSNSQPLSPQFKDPRARVASSMVGVECGLDDPTAGCNAVSCFDPRSLSADSSQ